jgi:hypothetical protein
MKVDERWREHELIFSNTYGGYFNPLRIWFLFKKLLQANSLPDVRFHDLRRFGDCKIALKGQKVRAITF